MGSLQYHVAKQKPCLFVMLLHHVVAAAAFIYLPLGALPLASWCMTPATNELPATNQRAIQGSRTDRQVGRQAGRQIQANTKAQEEAETKEAGR